MFTLSLLGCNGKIKHGTLRTVESLCARTSSSVISRNHTIQVRNLSHLRDNRTLTRNNGVFNTVQCTAMNKNIHLKIYSPYKRREFSTTFILGNIGLCLFERYVLSRVSWYAKVRRYIAITILVIVSLTVIYITVEGDYMTIVERHREAQLIGPETEALIAEKAFNYLYGKSFEYLPEDDPMVKRVEKIGKRIIFCSEVQELKDLEWTFYVAKSDSQLALGRPGGAVLITTAMIETLESDDELANVIGHEMGHILCHHVGANLVHMALFTAANLAFDILFRSTFLLTPLFEFAWNIPFWKQSEIESDFVGLVLMSRALYDYRSAPSYFERAVQQEKESGHGPSQVYLAFSSWPSSEQRLSVLQKWQEIARRHYIESKRKLWTEKSKKAGDQSNK